MSSGEEGAIPWFPEGETEAKKATRDRNRVYRGEKQGEGFPSVCQWIE